MEKEFQFWQVEDTTLFYLYTMKAILDCNNLNFETVGRTKEYTFLGCKQFSTIVCDDETDNASTSCQKILLKAPSILILDVFVKKNSYS